MVNLSSVPSPDGPTHLATALRQVKLMDAFTPEELFRLASLGTTSRVEPHQNVVIEGELSWGLYLVLEGSLGVFKSNKLTGDPFDLGQLEAGSFFGEMSLIDEQPRSATVRSLVPSHLFYIKKDAFQRFLDASPHLRLRFYETCVRMLVMRLRDLDDNYAISQYQLWKTALKKEAA